MTVQEELNDKPLFRLTDDRLNCTDNADMAADFESLPNLERFRRVKATCRNDPLSLAELVSVLRHRFWNAAGRGVGFIAWTRRQRHGDREQRAGGPSARSGDPPRQAWQD
jgi:hypothetical protein